MFSRMQTACVALVLYVPDILVRLEYFVHHRNRCEFCIRIYCTLAFLMPLSIFLHPFCASNRDQLLIAVAAVAAVADDCVFHCTYCVHNCSFSESVRLASGFDTCAFTSFIQLSL